MNAVCLNSESRGIDINTGMGLTDVSVEIFDKTNIHVAMNTRKGKGI